MVFITIIRAVDEKKYSIKAPQKTIYQLVRQFLKPHLRLERTDFFFLLPDAVASYTE